MSLQAFRDLDVHDFDHAPQAVAGRVHAPTLVSPTNLPESMLKEAPIPLSKKALVAACITRPIPEMPKTLQGLQFTLDGPTPFQEAGHRVLQVHPEKIAKAALLALATLTSTQLMDAKPVSQPATQEAKSLRNLQIKDAAMAEYGRMVQASHPHAAKAEAQHPITSDGWKSGVCQVGTALLLLAAAHRIRKAVAEDDPAKNREPGLIDTVVGAMTAKRKWREW